VKKSNVVTEAKAAVKVDPSFETVTDSKRSKKGGNKTEERQAEKAVEKKEPAAVAPLVASNDDSWTMVGARTKKAKEE
jgi:hypothetical protein